MSFTANQLMELLPPVHRKRDAELALAKGLTSGPLHSMMEIVAEQLAVVAENIEQSYDDLFIETCSPWVIPYIGDLIAWQGLHEKSNATASRQAVGHEIGLRRRKGTAVVLEQLARDITGWGATAVEFFQQLNVTQHTNHIRSGSYYSPNLRDSIALERVRTPFNKISHTVESRRIGSHRGRYNIANVGIFLWRIKPYRHTWSPAVRIAARRYIVAPLGNNTALYSRPSLDDGILRQLSTERNVPQPISRLQLTENIHSYYGFRESANSEIGMTNPSLVLEVGGEQISHDQIMVCNLADDGDGWAHQVPDDFYGIDPVLGRIVLPVSVDDNPIDDDVTVRTLFHSGFSADLGGGEYPRELVSPDPELTTTAQVPNQFETIQEALDSLSGAGVVEVSGTGHYQEQLTINVAANASIELRATEASNPHLQLSDSFVISGDENSQCVIDGFLISVNNLQVPDTEDNQLRQFELRHCTLVPGRSLDINGLPELPSDPSLIVEIPNLSVRIQQCICGPIRVVAESSVDITDSIIDANNRMAVAFAGLDEQSAGGSLSMSAVTLIGKVHARQFGTVSNSIFLARLLENDTWTAPVQTQRKQIGCVRFSFLPFDSIVPKPYHCQPNSFASAARITPKFRSLRYGNPAYAQLTPTNSELIKRGADDEGEMGAFHSQYQAQKETNLQIRLQEYLRVGLESGIFYES